MNKLTVLYVSHESNLGGAVQSLIDMLKELRNYIVPIVIIPSKGMIEDQLRNLEITYFIIPFQLTYGRIGGYKEIDENRGFINNYEAALQIVSIVQKENVDLIHTNSSVCDVGAMVAILTGIQHIWHIREVIREYSESEFWNRDLKIRLMNQAATVISISKYVKKSFLRNYGVDSLYIYNGLDFTKYQNNSDSEISKLGNKEFLLAGTIQSGKGQFEAVKAIEILKKSGINDISLTIVGNASQKYIWALKKYIKMNQLSSNVKVLSFQKDLKNLRNKAKYSLTCTKIEGLGRNTLEAMLFGNIVIGADTAGTLELIGEGQERGYLYKQGDSKDLARVIKIAMEDSEKEKSMRSKAAKAYVLSQFNVKDYAKKLLNIYYNAIDEESTQEVQKERFAICKEIEYRYNKEKDNIAFKLNNSNNKFQRLFACEEQWLHIRQSNRTLVEYFNKHFIKTIAIYGMGYLGCNLYDELEDSDIDVLYVIDKNPGHIGEVVEVVKADAEWNYVDAIVITAIDDEESLKQYVQNKCSYKALGIKEILYDFEI